jgi:hypothetical protein
MGCGILYRMVAERIELCAMLATRRTGMFVVDESYWELVWMQQILEREILLGDQIPKHVGSIHSIAI